MNESTFDFASFSIKVFFRQCKVIKEQRRIIKALAAKLNDTLKENRNLKGGSK